MFVSSLFTEGGGPPSMTLMLIVPANPGWQNVIEVCDEVTLHDLMNVKQKTNTMKEDVAP